MGIRVTHGANGNRPTKPMPRSAPVKPFGMPITPFNPVTGKYLPLGPVEATTEASTALLCRCTTDILSETSGTLVPLKYDSDTASFIDDPDEDSLSAWNVDVVDVAEGDWVFVQQIGDNNYFLAPFPYIDQEQEMEYKVLQLDVDGFMVWDYPRGHA